MAEQTARQSTRELEYKANMAHVMGQLEVIKRRLEDHATEAGAAFNYGHIGDLRNVSNSLGQVIDFLSQEEE